MFNVYCDESCHLLHDESNVMALGAVWAPKEKVKEIHHRISEIKNKNNIPYELKWTKISSNNYQVYLDIVDYFFDESDLHFRGVVIPDKTILNHKKFNQDHETWYYKMFFLLLREILQPRNYFNIYLDYKDTNGNLRIQKLKEVLSNSFYDFSQKIIKNIQLVKSHQVGMIQLTDIMIGALTYYHRDLHGNDGKLKVIEKIKKRSGYSLEKNTLQREQKFNLFIWQGSWDC